MIDIDAIRLTLATALRTADLGATVYDEIPGSPTTPAIVVGLPTNITFEQSYTLGVVDMALVALTGPMFNRAAEVRLMTLALAAVAAVRGVTSAAVAAVRFMSIDTITEFTAADGVSLYSANINITVIAPTQET